MIVTEEEAKTKFCPHMRAPHSINDKIFTYNVKGTPLEYTQCIASDCMMWKVYDKKSSKGLCGLVYPRMMTIPK